MSGAGHTPGPWDGQINVCHISGSDFQIGWLNTDNPDRKAEGQANARLIAAAPELLKALDLLLAIAEMTTFSDQYPAQCELARAAIAKARGAA
jgi:hypothetical protein